MLYPLSYNDISLVIYYSRMRLLDKSLGFWARKVLHFFVNGGIAIAALSIPVEALRPLTVVGFVLILVFESIRLKTRAKQYVHEAVGPLFKAEEALDYSGLFWASVGALIMALFASQQAYSYGFAILAVCDASAAIIGKWWGQKPFYMNKTFAGSAACLVAAFIVSFVYAQMFALPVPAMAFASSMALILTFIEVYCYPFDDNFLILVAAAYGFQIAAFWS